MKYTISSEFDCLVDIKDEKFELIGNLSKIEIFLEEKEKVTFLVYPIDLTGAIAYAVNISAMSNKSQPHTMIYQINELEYEMILLPFIMSKNEGSVKYTVGDLSFSLSQGQINYLTCFDKNNEYQISFSEKLNDYKIEHIKNNVFLHSKNTGEDQVFILFDRFNKKFHKYIAKEVEINENIIKLVVDENTMAKHGTKYEICLEDNQIKYQKKLVYLNKKPKLAKKDCIIPFAFFEAIKINDYNLAIQYLHDELKLVMSKNVILDYFGSFEKVKSYNYKKEKGYYLCLLGNKKGTVFRFDIRQGKIFEIERIS